MGLGSKVSAFVIGFFWCWGFGFGVLGRGVWGRRVCSSDIRSTVGEGGETERRLLGAMNPETPMEYTVI